MSRNIDDLMDKPWPPVGKNLGVCLSAKIRQSKNKKTPSILLTWESEDGEYGWSDDVFCTVKALKRVALVAKRVCGFKDELPDNDLEALDDLVNFIVNNIVGKKAVNIIEEKIEIFIPDSGPNMGRKTTITKKRVAFSGYVELEKSAPVNDASPTETGNSITGAQEEKKESAKQEDKDDLPF